MEAKEKKEKEEELKLKEYLKKKEGQFLIFLMKL